MRFIRFYPAHFVFCNKDVLSLKMHLATTKLWISPENCQKFFCNLWVILLSSFTEILVLPFARSLEANDGWVPTFWGYEKIQRMDVLWIQVSSFSLTVNKLEKNSTFNLSILKTLLSYILNSLSWLIALFKPYYFLCNSSTSFLSVLVYLKDAFWSLLISRCT